VTRVDVVLLNTLASMQPLPDCPHVTVARHQGESWLRWAQKVQAAGRSGGQLWRFRGNAANIMDNASPLPNATAPTYSSAANICYDILLTHRAPPSGFGERRGPPEIPRVLPIVIHLNDRSAFQMRLLRWNSS
jgi:hypothetical protein